MSKVSDDADFQNFLDRFINEVKRHREEELGLGMRMSYVQCAYMRTDESAEGDLAPIYIHGKIGSSNIAVDGFRINDSDDTIILACADFYDFERVEQTLTNTELEAIVKRMRVFVSAAMSGRAENELSVDYTTPEYDLIDHMHAHHPERVRVLVFTERKLSTRIKTVQPEPVGNVFIEVQVWPIERIFEIDKSGMQHQDNEVVFDDPVILHQTVDGESFKAYIGSISAKTLAKIYKENGARILEGNVRSFLTTKMKVNRQIRDTLLKEPEKFFIYNNGIAATAKQLVFDGDDGERLIGAVDFQIINGGQTTATISQTLNQHRAQGADDPFEKVQVPIKITCIDESLPLEQVQAMVVSISKASNSQNAIKDADFFSSHPFHLEMAKLSESTMAPAVERLSGSHWFYERSRGAYAQKFMFCTEAERKKLEAKYPPGQVVRKEDLARVRLLWTEVPRPDVVSKGSAALFKEFSKIVDEKWKKRDEVDEFDERYFKDSVSLLIIRNELRKAVYNSDFYNGGYLANIVDYTLAVLAYRIIEEWGGLSMFNLEPVWRKQDADASLLNVLTVIAEIVLQDIQDQSYSQRVSNVTQWCKRSECWECVKKRFSRKKLLDSIRSTFCAVKSGSQGTSPTSELVEVWKYRHWKEALKFASQGASLSARQYKAINDAAEQKIQKIERASIALQALEELRSQGFEL